jgi:hypothetical protein
MVRGVTARWRRAYVVLEHDLVDDTAAGLPEANAVLLGRRGKEFEDFLHATDHHQ